VLPPAASTLPTPLDTGVAACSRPCTRADAMTNPGVLGHGSNGVIVPQMNVGLATGNGHSFCRDLPVVTVFVDRRHRTAQWPFRLPGVAGVSCLGNEPGLLLLNGDGPSINFLFVNRFTLISPRQSPNRLYKGAANDPFAIITPSADLRRVRPNRMESSSGPTVKQRPGPTAFASRTCHERLANDLAVCFVDNATDQGQRTKPSNCAATRPDSAKN